METPKPFFRGALWLTTINKIDEDFISDLFLDRIIDFDSSRTAEFNSHDNLGFFGVLSQEEEERINKKNDLEFKFPLYFNKVFYKLNEIIENDIYDLIEEYCEVYNVQMQFEENSILQKLNSYYDKQKKIECLKELHEEVISEIPLLKYDEYLLFSNRKKTKNHKEWKELVVSYVIKSPDILISYLKKNEENGFRDYIFQLVDLYFMSQPLSDFCIIRLWRYYFTINRKLDLISEQLKKIIDDQPKPLTPLQQVIFIDRLRALVDTFSKESIGNKIKWLNNITKGVNYDEKVQLKALECLVSMSRDDVDDLVEKSVAKYARLILPVAISPDRNYSDRNMRRAITSYHKKSHIKKENIRSDEDEKEYQKYKKVNEEIENANEYLNQYF